VFLPEAEKAYGLKVEKYLEMSALVHLGQKIVEFIEDYCLCVFAF
jgi:hypothetical protein